jgi:thiol:disulfide interchange protein DsbC
MNKTLKKVLISLATACTLLTNNATAMENKHFSDLQVFKDINGKIIGNTIIGKNLDLYLVKGIDASGTPFEAIVDKDGNYIILSSKVIDVKTQTPISIPLNVSGLKGKEAFTYGEGKKDFYVFTDPQCPYCKRFTAIWPEIKKDVKLHIFFFNLTFHKEADSMTKWVLDGKSNDEKVERLLKISKGDTSYSNAKYSEKREAQLNKIIEDQKKIGMNLGINGVPATIDSSGKSIRWIDLKSN